MHHYQIFLNEFIKKNYAFIKFNAPLTASNQMLLRHDIDFDIDYAYKMAQLEKDLNVVSTYFFLMRSDAYNILEPDNINKIKLIKDMGHTISIHFDPTLYDDLEKGFLFEKSLFEQLFDVSIDIISIHRPHEIFLNGEQSFCGVGHTYAPKYFKDIKYISDSGGQFKYGHPYDSEAFKHNDTIQLLIHPIWWVFAKDQLPVDCLNAYVEERKGIFKQFIANNCIPYANYLEGNL